MTNATYHFETKHIVQNLTAALSLCNKLSNSQLLQLQDQLQQKEETSHRNELLVTIEYVTEKRGLLY